MYSNTVFDGKTCINHSIWNNSSAFSLYSEVNLKEMSHGYYCDQRVMEDVKKHDSLNKDMDDLFF